VSFIGKRWKQIEYGVQSAGFALPGYICSYLEILQNTHEGKNLHAFGDIDEPPPYDLVNGKVM
jgi:hypothetical protein